MSSRSPRSPPRKLQYNKELAYLVRSMKRVRKGTELLDGYMICNEPTTVTLTKILRLHAAWRRKLNQLHYFDTRRRCYTRKIDEKMHEAIVETQKLIRKYEHLAIQFSEVAIQPIAPITFDMPSNNNQFAVLEISIEPLASTVTSSISSDGYISSDMEEPIEPIASSAIAPFQYEMTNSDLLDLMLTLLEISPADPL